MNTQTRLATQQWTMCLLALVLLLAIISLIGCAPTPTPTPIPPPTATPLPPTATPVPTPTSPPPGKPVTEPPEGTDVLVEAGKKLPLRANATGAKRYEWKLLGDGSLSATPGDTVRDAVIYTAPETAPEPGGGIAIVTVTAFNDQGMPSPPTSLTIRIVSIAASVRLDALAVPAGWMSGTGDPKSRIGLGVSPSGCHTGADCLQVTYTAGGVFGGIYWWPGSCGESGTPEAWEKVKRGTCGTNVLKAGNLSAVKRLTFWARGDQGGEVVEFKIGAVDIMPSPGRSLGRVTLTREWKKYEIGLEGMDLTNAIALFAWIAADIDNPQGAIFYLDDIQFEGLRE
jgi:hypothetical protein